MSFSLFDLVLFKVKNNQNLTELDQFTIDEHLKIDGEEEQQQWGGERGIYIYIY